MLLNRRLFFPVTVLRFIYTERKRICFCVLYQCSIKILKWILYESRECERYRFRFNISEPLWYIIFTGFTTVLLETPAVETVHSGAPAVRISVPTTCNENNRKYKWFK